MRIRKKRNSEYNKFQKQKYLMQRKIDHIQIDPLTKQNIFYTTNDKESITVKTSKKEK